MSIAGRGMLQIIIVLGVSGGIPASRVVRGAVLGVKENVYFQAAQAIGSSRRRSLLRHVLPNIAAPIIIIFSINVGGAIMSEAALSFLGFGLPPTFELGRHAQPGGAAVHGDCAHLALWPGLCLTVVVYSLNMFGDAVRDLLDPRLRGRLVATAPAGTRTTNARSHGADPEIVWSWAYEAAPPQRATAAYRIAHRRSEHTRGPDQSNAHPVRRSRDWARPRRNRLAPYGIVFLSLSNSNTTPEFSSIRSGESPTRRWRTSSSSSNQSLSM